MEVYISRRHESSNLCLIYGKVEELTIEVRYFDCIDILFSSSNAFIKIQDGCMPPISPPKGLSLIKGPSEIRLHLFIGASD